MGKRKRADKYQFHCIIRPDIRVVHEFLEMQKRLEAQPYSSVAAPRVFALEELLALILSYLSPQDLLRSQRVNQAFHRAVNSYHTQQKLFFTPNQDETQVAWNPLRGAAIPEWFRMARRTPIRVGETRIITFYDREEGKEAIRSSRVGKGASWRRMLICQPALRSIHVLHKGITVKRRANLEQVTMGDVHDKIEFVRSHKRCPRFRDIKIGCSEQGLELIIDLIPYDQV